MANIAITSKCNLNCSYCFARAEFEDKGPSNQHMSLETFRMALDFIQRSDIDQVRILGGEPTKHPQFMEIMNMALATGLDIRLFSNGMISGPVLHYLSTLDVQNVTIVMNVTRLESKSSNGLEQVFEQLGDKIMPGYNFYHKQAQPGFLLSLIERYGLQRKIRMGIAHPCVGYANAHIGAQDFRSAGQKIVELAQQAKTRGIRISLDCGFPPCMFDGHDIDHLGLDPQMGLHCEPILDILPDGSVIPCYALAKTDKMKITPQTMEADLRTAFAASLQSLRDSGIYKYCGICHYRSQGLCHGGGVCHKIARFTRRKQKNMYS